VFGLNTGAARKGQPPAEYKSFVNCEGGIYAPRMKTFFRKLWGAYKNVGATRGLLQWIGLWPWVVAAAATVGTWLWARITHLTGPEQFVLALVVFVFVVFGIVVIRLFYLAFSNKPIPNTTTEPKTIMAEVAPANLQAVESLEAVRFDYLPIPPTEKGWTRAYKSDGVANFGTDHDIDDSLRVEVTQSEFAMDYIVPVHATLANRLKFTAKYNNSENMGTATMVFALVEVSSKNKEQRQRFWIKFYFGEKHAYQTPGGWHDGVKQLPEQTVYWPAVPLQKGQLKFDIDLPEAVRLAVGSQGWVFKGIYKIRLRGNLSISPIEFAR
jgi:hypothetical protein